MLLQSRGVLTVRFRPPVRFKEFPNFRYLLMHHKQFLRYLQIELDNESKELVTINTQQGLYRYNRLPFGIKSALLIFQKLMNQLTNKLNRRFAYLDDIVVESNTLEEPKIRLCKVFDRLQKYRLKVNLDKCKLFGKEIKFLGHIINGSLSQIQIK